MIHTKAQKFLSLLLSVQYKSNENGEYDYSTQPRPCHNLAFMLESEPLIKSNAGVIQLKAGEYAVYFSKYIGTFY